MFLGVRYLTAIGETRVSWPRGVFSFIKVDMMIANGGKYSLFMSLSSINQRPMGHNAHLSEQL